jgi:DNA-binding response OmpR family regulator
VIVLVVEDNPTTAELLRDLLRAKGWTVEWAATGAGALIKIKAVCPDVAVLDYGLTDLPGEVVLKALLEVVPHVVIFSAEPYDRLRELHKAHPNLRILTKPMEAEAVMKAIEDTAQFFVKGPAPGDCL